MNEESLQIDGALNICTAADQPLKGRMLADMFLEIIGHPQGWKIYRFSDDSRVIAVEFSNGFKHLFCLAAVTFLGGNGNHPIFKKRIQLKQWYKDIYFRHNSKNCIVHFLGIYHYNGNVVFVDFAPETYVKRKMHNSSAFVYINDLFRAMQDGIAVRIDLHGNKITTVRANEMVNYLQGDRSLALTDNEELLKVFEDFNKAMPFGVWLNGGEIINKMYESSWPKWRETEWAGWYLEFEFDSFLKKNNIDCVLYRNQSNRDKFFGDIDFDLFFPKHKFYGDLKASDCSKDEAPGNDKETVADAISRFGRLWYIIYEHDTVKDKDRGGEVCKMRYTLLLKDPKSVAKSPQSYIARMKNSVNFRSMMILELNRANCNGILKDFHQGRQPDGAARATKVLITKKNVENFQIFYYSV